MKLESKEDLDSLIKNKISESTKLEYKDPRALNNNIEIARDISAMANSNGGIIIYGLCEEEKDHTPTKIDWIRDHKNKEKIEQVVTSNIIPQIDELKIYTIPNPDNNKEFVIIVEVPKSDRAPHQLLGSKKYYRRRNFTIYEMEHYEIEDLFFTRKHPILDVSFKYIERDTYDIILINNGKVIAEKIAMKISLPSIFEISDKQWEKIEKKENYSAYQYFQDKMPCYPRLPMVIGRIYYPKKDYISKIGISFYIVCKDTEIKYFNVDITHTKPIITKVKDMSELQRPYHKEY